MNSFYYATSVFAFNKSKTHHVGLQQNKSYCPAKEIINKMKRQLTGWEKIFANHLSDKGLIPKIHKELIELKSKTINNPVKNWQRT